MPRMERSQVTSPLHKANSGKGMDSYFQVRRDVYLESKLEHQGLSKHGLLPAQLKNQR